MKPKQNEWTIVVVGFWNRMIFTPEWVGNRLESKEIEKFFPLSPIAPLIYRDDDLKIEVGDQRLLVGMRRYTQTCREKARTVACRILQDLPYTPVSAFGINFGFLESSPSDDLLRLFDCADNASFVQCGYEIKLHEIKREIFNEGNILNLTLRYSSGEISIHGNFHYEVDDASRAKTILQDKVEPCYDRIINLISTVYNLELFREEQS